MPRWYLEELSIPYQWRQLNLETGEHRQPSFTDINPFGKVPALVDNSVEGVDGQPLKLFESGAILLHLAEHYGHEFAGPSQQANGLRALVAQWLLFANATLAVALFVPSNREREFPRLMDVLNEQLQANRYLVGSRWGAADCAVQAYLAYLPIFFSQISLAPWPQIQASIAATQANKAYQLVMDQG